MRFTLLGLLVLLAPSCAVGVSPTPDEDQAGADDEQAAAADCFVDEAGLGVTGLVVQAGDTRVTVEEWINKDGEVDEYIGFVVSVEGGPLRYQVKSGGQIYIDTSTMWMNPHGTSGPAVKSITNVDFCPP